MRFIPNNLSAIRRKKDFAFFLLLLAISLFLAGFNNAYGQSMSTQSPTNTTPTAPASPVSTLMQYQYSQGVPSHYADTSIPGGVEQHAQGPNGGYQTNKQVAEPVKGPNWPTVYGVEPAPMPPEEQAILKDMGVGGHGEPVSVNEEGRIMNAALQSAAQRLQTPGQLNNVAREAQNTQTQQGADNNGDMARNQAGAALQFVQSGLQNFTVDGTNQWNVLRNNLFVWMAVLLMLPGAVATQAKATVAGGFPLFREIVTPLEGIFRSMVGIFLIPATYLIVNYGIDVSNSIAFSIKTQYQALFGSDMYKDAMGAENRAYATRNPNENLGHIPNQTTDVNTPLNPQSPPTTPFGSLENTMGVVADNAPYGARTAPQNRANEAMPYFANQMRGAYNGMGAALTTTWNILCAFQMCYLYYLWFVGPIMAALWVWPVRQLRDAFPNWCEGVITICFWSLFWNTTVLLMACFRGVDVTGTVIMSALNFLATASVKFAFDFAGLVRAAGHQVGAMAEKAGSGGGGGGQQQGGGGQQQGGGGGQDGRQQPDGGQGGGQQPGGGQGTGLGGSSNPIPGGGSGGPGGEQGPGAKPANPDLPPPGKSNQPGYAALDQQTGGSLGARSAEYSSAYNTTYNAANAAAASGLFSGGSGGLSTSGSNGLLGWVPGGTGATGNLSHIQSPALNNVLPPPLTRDQDLTAANNNIAGSKPGQESPGTHPLAGPLANSFIGGLGGVPSGIAMIPAFDKNNAQLAASKNADNQNTASPNSANPNQQPVDPNAITNNPPLTADPLISTNQIAMGTTGMTSTSPDLPPPANTSYPAFSRDSISGSSVSPHPHDLNAIPQNQNQGSYNNPYTDPAYNPQTFSRNATPDTTYPLETPTQYYTVDPNVPPQSIQDVYANYNNNSAPQVTPDGYTNNYINNSGYSVPDNTYASPTPVQQPPTPDPYVSRPTPPVIPIIIPPVASNNIPVPRQQAEPRQYQVKPPQPGQQAAIPPQQQQRQSGGVNSNQGQIASSNPVTSGTQKSMFEQVRDGLLKHTKYTSGRTSEEEEELAKKLGMQDSDNQA